ncbi:metallo-beta-lactamase domain-containing protein 1-like protein, partial [Aphelenchoides avenae]
MRLLTLLTVLSLQCGIRAQLKVVTLVDGVLEQVAGTQGTFKFVATITLVQMPGMNMIVDTTSPTDTVTRDKLLQKLYSMQLSPQQINVLVLTHGHPDHAGHASLFPNAKLVTDFFETTRDIYVANELRQ